MSFSSVVQAEGLDEYLNESGAGKVLVDLLESIAVVKPKDYTNFIIAFMQNLQNRESDEMEEEDSNVGEDINLDEIPEYMKNRKRRGAVSSEPNGEVQALNMPLKESQPKDAKTNERLNAALSRHILCSHLDESERQEVFDHMSELQFDKDSYVIKQGNGR